MANMIAEQFLTFTYFLWALTLFVLFINVCWYVDAFTMDLQWIFKQLRIQSRPKIRKVRNRLAFERVTGKIVKDAIQLHCDIIKFVF